MYKYAKFDSKHAIQGVMSIFTEINRLAKMMLRNPGYSFAYQWLDNIEINKYAKFDHNISYSLKSYEEFH